MVVDTSALVAVLFDEPERDDLVALLARAEDPLISAATLVEASIVMQARTGDDGVADLDGLLGASSVRCIAVDIEQARVAREAFERYGRDARRPGSTWATASRTRWPRSGTGR
jgi:ribonuclease VapC